MVLWYITNIYNSIEYSKQQREYCIFVWIYSNTKLIFEYVILVNVKLISNL